MMFKCCDCGHMFKDGERKTILTDYGVHDGFYDTVAVCPVCNGSFEEVFQCKKCGEWLCENEIHEGWCEDCLKEQITYQSFFDYCEANRHENYLDIFVMDEFLDMDMPKKSSVEFHALMIDFYKKQVANVEWEQSVYGKARNPFINKCIRFVLEDDGSAGQGTQDNSCDFCE